MGSVAEWSLLVASRRGKGGGGAISDGEVGVTFFVIVCRRSSEGRDRICCG